jgi:hypothetical protein
MLRHILVPTLAATLCAGEAAPSPIASLALADGPDISRHWDASIYGRVWTDPGLAWVRQQWAQQKAGWKVTPGVDVDGLLSSATGMRGEFLGMTAGPDPKPKLRFQADFGAQAQAVFALASKRARPDVMRVAGADEARLLDVGGPVLARHGTRLVIGYQCEALPWPVVPVQVDARLSIEYSGFMKAIAEVMPKRDREQFDRSLHDMQPWLGLLGWDASLVPQGMHEVLSYDKPSVGVNPVDRVLLDRFPADALAVAGVGADMPAMWKIAGSSWLDSLDQAMHRGQRLGAEATKQEIDAVLAGMGVTGGLQQLITDLHGTFAIGVTQGIPFPGVSIVVPSTPSIDTLLGVGLGAMGAQVPAVGASSIIPVPNLPIMISLARDRTHWLLTSDAQFVQPWLAGTPGGFLASPSGKAMLAKAPAGSYLLGSLDTAGVLRVATPYVSMGLAQARHMPNDVRQAILAGLSRLTRESSPSWAWSAPEGPGSRTEAEGPLGMGVVPIAIIAAIAIPNLLESRVAANEAAASATLKSGIFPAQVQFQAGAYMDQDLDNIGEYGTLAELSGRLKTSRIEAGSLRLLTGPLADGDSASGYRYRMYLPDGKGGALTSDDQARTADAAASNAQERAFACYAWPQSTDTGRRMFVLTADGQVRSLPWDGQEPAWNASLPGGWDAPASWPVWGYGRVQPAPEQVEAGPDPKALF